jgi:hypothetical protein
MGQQVYQMTRMFTSDDSDEGSLFDLFDARMSGLKGVEYHVQM